MLRALCGVLAASVLGLKLFSFRHVAADDPTVTLFLGAWVGGANDVRGALPRPADQMIALARGENGFALEPIYHLAMGQAWLIVAACAMVALLSGRIGRRRPPRP